MRSTVRKSIKMGKFLILALSLFLYSCEESEPLRMDGLTFDQKAFDSHRQHWESANILNYSFDQELFSTAVGKLPIVKTIIHNGELDTAIIEPNNRISFTLDHSYYYEKVEDIYSFIERVVEDSKENINSPDKAMKGAKITVEYDGKFHYPTKVNCIGYYPRST